MATEEGVIGFSIQSPFKGGISKERKQLKESCLNLRANGQIYLNGKIVVP
jgi:hypothetical protein